MDRRQPSRLVRLRRGPLALSGVVVLASLASGCLEMGSEESSGGQDPFRVESYVLVMELGQEGDPITFGAIVPGFLQDEGSLIVAEYLGSAILRISMDGPGVEVLGGEGDGPGEFRQIRAVGFRSDSLIWVADRATGRATLIDGRGRTHATSTVTDFYFGPPVRPVGATAVLADGSLLVTPDRPQAMWMLTDTLFQQPLIRVGWDARSVDTLFNPPPAHLGLDLYIPDVWDSPLHTARVLREDAQVDVSPDGGLIGFLHRTHGLDDRTGATLYLVDVTRPEAGVDSVRIPIPPVPFSRDEVEDRVARMGLGVTGRTPSNLADGFIRHFRSNMEALPEWISPLVRLRIDSEHSLWLGVEDVYLGDLTWYRRRRGEQDWSRVDLERPVWRLIDAWGDQVAGILRDDLGVQTLAVFERIY
jgi:hypothetical protein